MLEGEKLLYAAVSDCWMGEVGISKDDYMAKDNSYIYFYLPSKGDELFDEDCFYFCQLSQMMESKKR